LRGLENDPELELQLAAYEYALSEYHHSQSQSQSHSRSAGSGKGAEDEVGEVDLVLNSQGRYLVQRWSGGTVCDMTGRPRRIEIQFHCRMGGVDEISSIKEIATCVVLRTSLLTTSQMANAR
jgi:protein OS-9